MRLFSRIEIGMGLIGAGLLLYAVSEARGHEAIASKKQPLGWQYGYECCSAVDCSQARDGDIVPTPAGWLISRTKEVIPYNDRRIKRSKDEYFHRCVPGGNEDAPRSLCVYVPDMAG